MTVKDNGVESQATYVAKGFVLDPKFLANLDVDGKNEYVTRLNCRRCKYKSYILFA